LTDWTRYVWATKQVQGTLTDQKRLCQVDNTWVMEQDLGSLERLPNLQQPSVTLIFTLSSYWQKPNMQAVRVCQQS
jgi:hypothetical protein